MAKLRADGTLTAMSQRAHSILASGGHGLSQLGEIQKLVAPPVQPPVNTDAASGLRAIGQTQQADAQSQLARLAAINASRFSALGVNPYQPRAAAMGAQVNAQNLQALIAKLKGGGGGDVGPGGLEFLPGARDATAAQGLSDEDVAAAAARYASGRSYGGSPYTPGAVMQEGHYETRTGPDGRPWIGQLIKYRTAAGDSTEWTPERPA